MFGCGAKAMRGGYIFICPVFMPDTEFPLSVQIPNICECGGQWWWGNPCTWEAELEDDMFEAMFVQYILRFRKPELTSEIFVSRKQKKETKEKKKKP